MQAAVACAGRGIARCLLLGPPDEVTSQARPLGLRLPAGVTIVDPRAVAERYVGPLATCGARRAGPRKWPGASGRPGNGRHHDAQAG